MGLLHHLAGALSPDSADLRGNTFSPEIPSGFPLLQLMSLFCLLLLHRVGILCMDPPSSCLFAEVAPSWPGFCGVGFLWSSSPACGTWHTAVCQMPLPRTGECFDTQGLEEVRCQLENHPMCP